MMIIRVDSQITNYTDTNNGSNTYIDEYHDGCKGFSDEPITPATAKYFLKNPPLTCKNSKVPSYLYVTENGDFLKINKDKIKSLKAKVDYCQYSSIKRKSDYNVLESPMSKTFTDSISLPNDVEHIYGECFSQKKLVGLSYLSILRKNPTLEATLNESYRAFVQKEKPKETLSVLMIGVDGTSKLNFARQMPKTKSFVLNKMGGIEFYKLNKLGLNTLPNVIPLLTGFSKKELMQKWTKEDYFDKIDDKFITDEARKAGYRTSFILDRIDITSFHYLKNGWNKPKFHYYHRPVVIKSEKDRRARAESSHCVGDTDEITLLYDYWLQLTQVFNNSKMTPYFGYSFFTRVTHDDVNKASIVDHIYLKLFQTLWAQNSLNNTLVIFFSDHGSRFGNFRQTFLGMLEDSNPFMIFIFPPWFEKKYPKIMANFRKNQNRLITNFDAHATLKDILYFQGDEIAERPPAKKVRSISLFQELPKSRTCDEAEIPLDFCNCRNFSTHGITSELKADISKVLVKAVNAKTKKVRDKCEAVTLNETMSVISLNVASKTKYYYEATIKTSPGGAVFQASVKKTLSTGKFSVSGDIARISMYKGQADCIMEYMTRPYCYCKNLL